jgi:dsDNA-binding SOS-regulon protein
MIVAQKVQVDKFMSKKMYTEIPKSGNDTKMEIRYEIERQVNNLDVPDYDIYDMVADMANALKDIINHNPGSEAVAKFLTRQDQISQILKTIKEKNELL